LSALQSIRKKCLWCSNDQPKEVLRCQSPKCPLYEYRWGKMPKIEKPSPLRAIRTKCFDCVGFSPSDVKDCSDSACALHAFRFGHSPNYSEQTKKKQRDRYFDGLAKNRLLRAGFSRDRSEDEAEHTEHDLSRMVTG